MLSNTQQCSIMLSHSQQFSGMLSSTQQYSEMLSSTQQFSAIYRDAQQYSEMLSKSQRFSASLSNAQQVSEMLRHTQQCSVLLSKIMYTRQSTFKKERELPLWDNMNDKDRKHDKNLCFFVRESSLAMVKIPPQEQLSRQQSKQFEVQMLGFPWLIYCAIYKCCGCLNILNPSFLLLLLSKISHCA